MNRCLFCEQVISHRIGFPEHGELDGFDYRTDVCGPDADMCEASPSGAHAPDDATGSWHHQPMQLGGPNGTTFKTRYEWARAAFYNERAEHYGELATDIPPRLRKAITRLYSVYPSMPQGICDPAYMAHVIMREVGLS